MKTTEPSPQDEKLQKVLARAGQGSRREMERAIAEGRVKVNGVVATLGDRVTDADKIQMDGHHVRIKKSEADATRVILYNKPEGQICSRNDPEGRPTVYENLPRLASGRWISVGRLDFNTSGLLLFTNDGELAHKLMHPSSNIDREYLVRVQGEVDGDLLQRLRDGVLLEDGLAKFTDIVPGAQEGSNRWFYCVVMEGKNREVRRLWESQECRVSRLKRVRYGNIFIPSNVRVGQWIELEDKELKELCQTAEVPVPERKFSAGLQDFRDRQRRRLESPSSSRAGRPNSRKAPDARTRPSSAHFDPEIASENTAQPRTRVNTRSAPNFDNGSDKRQPKPRQQTSKKSGPRNKDRRDDFDVFTGELGTNRRSDQGKPSGGRSENKHGKDAKGPKGSRGPAGGRGAKPRR